MQVFEGVGLFLVCFSRHKNQSSLVTTVFKMSIYRVMAQIGGATDEPLRKGGIGVIANLLGLDLPIHCFGLFSPKIVAVFDRTLMKLRKRTHEYASPSTFY